uniref:Uncharacterized protein n=1 Tax=viral metagenome TaxID=1070528 RepID=A0A6H1ZX95_9ZZZZ
MHIAFAARGQYELLYRYIHDLQSLLYEWKLPNGRKCHLRMGVRPLWLGELVFPEERYMDVLQDIAPYRLDGGKYGNLWPFRYMFKLEKIKEVVNPSMRIHHPYVDMVLIGKRKDQYDPTTCIELL